MAQGMPPVGPVTRLGRYVLIKETAGSGVATTWVARTGDEPGARLCTILRLHRHVTKKVELAEAFLNEARHAQKLKHPNVLQVLETGIADGEVFVVTDHVESESLAALTTFAGTEGLPLPVILRIAIDVLEALAASHSLATPLVHGELNPFHIRVGTNGVTRVGGFGVARALARLGTHGIKNHDRLSYGAPERVKAMAVAMSNPATGPLDPRSDLFSVAATLWECISKQRLFTSKIEAAVIQKVLTAPIASLKEKEPDLPSEVEEAVMKGLERDPDRRFAKAEDFIMALEGAGPDQIASAEKVAAAVEKLAGKAIATRRADIEAALAGKMDTGSRPPPAPRRNATLVGVAPTPETAAASLAAASAAAAEPSTVALGKPESIPPESGEPISILEPVAAGPPPVPTGPLTPAPVLRIGESGLPTIVDEDSVGDAATEVYRAPHARQRQATLLGIPPHGEGTNGTPQPPGARVVRTPLEPLPAPPAPNADEGEAAAASPPDVEAPSAADEAVPAADAPTPAVDVSPLAATPAPTGTDASAPPKPADAPAKAPLPKRPGASTDASPRPPGATTNGTSPKAETPAPPRALTPPPGRAAVAPPKSAFAARLEALRKGEAPKKPELPKPPKPGEPATAKSLEPAKPPPRKPEGLPARPDRPKPLPPPGRPEPPASLTPSEPSKPRGPAGTALDQLGPGSSLGRYEILMQLARGGMASIWAARQQGSRGFQKIVAIKTMLPDVSDDPDFEKMFLDEARVAARIRHPNVVEILDLGEERDVLYLVMEWVEGETVGSLQKAAKQKSGIPLPIVLRIASQVCAGLHAAHELRDDGGALLNLVHRDISPANVIVSTAGFVKIVDFGIAKSKGRLHVTRAGGVIKGKTPYLSPEQLGGQPVDRRSDIFSLGALLYVLATGLHPFRGETEFKTVENIAIKDPVPLRDLVADIHPEFEKIVLRALEKKPEKRFETAGDMQRAIDELAQSIGKPVTDEDIGAFVQSTLGDSLKERAADVKAAIAARDSGVAPAIKPAKDEIHDDISLDEEIELEPASSESVPAPKVDGAKAGTADAVAEAGGRLLTPALSHDPSGAAARRPDDEYVGDSDGAAEDGGDVRAQADRKRVLQMVVAGLIAGGVILFLLAVAGGGKDKSTGRPEASESARATATAAMTAKAPEPTVTPATAEPVRVPEPPVTAQAPPPPEPEPVKTAAPPTAPEPPTKAAAPTKKAAPTPPPSKAPPAPPTKAVTKSPTPPSKAPPAPPTKSKKFNPTGI